MDILLRATHRQSHRRMIDMGHLAKRQTPFVIVRASLPAASVRDRTGKSANVTEADARQGSAK